MFGNPDVLHQFWLTHCNSLPGRQVIGRHSTLIL